MNEHALVPRAAENPETPDWRRLEVALGRHSERIADGIAWARAEQREIDDVTARCIANVLGRAFGDDSTLATFSRTGDVAYEALRDEYLDLYNSDQATPITRELVDWFGTYLVTRTNTGTGRQFMNEHLPPRLDQLLVRTTVTVGRQDFTVNIPASWDGRQIEGLTETLADLRLAEDDALQAFLSLPDVSAGAGDIMAAFDSCYIHTFASLADAAEELSEASELEKEVYDYAAEHHFFIEHMVPDYEALLDRVRDGYDVIEWRGRTYAFYK